MDVLGDGPDRRERCQQVRMAVDNAYDSRARVAVDAGLLTRLVVPRQDWSQCSHAALAYKALLEAGQESPSSVEARIFRRWERGGWKPTCMHWCPWLHGRGLTFSGACLAVVPGVLAFSGACLLRTM